MKYGSASTKKNSAGFTESQLELLLNYCRAVRENPVIPFSVFHGRYSTYSRKKSTIDLIRKGYFKSVVTGPILFANAGIEVFLSNDSSNSKELFEECKKDEKTTLALILHGYWTNFQCKRGASTLQYHDTILPNSARFSDEKDKDLLVDIKGKLPDDPYPKRWHDLHWKIYYSMKHPRNKTYREVGKEIKSSWVTVRKYFLEVLTQCKIISNFFPLGIEAYSPLFVTFKTDYEIGIIRALKTLRNTTYLYKAEDKMMLLLCISPEPRAHNRFTEKFVHLEEVGLISDLHTSTPYDWYRAF
jgi:hypothetical protein